MQPSRRKGLLSMERKWTLTISTKDQRICDKVSRAVMNIALQLPTSSKLTIEPVVEAEPVKKAKKK